MSAHKGGGTLFAISDLHVGFPENYRLVEGLQPDSGDDWLIVAGDTAETFADVEWALRTLRAKFGGVVWVPGNHELWTPMHDPVQLRGERRYWHLVEMCRKLGVITPEDPYPVWRGNGGPVTIVPLFLLYDYTFLPDGAHTKAKALARAYEAGVVCSDEVLLHSDPYPSREYWCLVRIEEAKRRLEARNPALRTVLVNHFPLVREPTRVLYHQEFTQWCGTDKTADWHLAFNAAVVVYGHLHIPRTTWYDGVRFEEVSLGYPREWRARGGPRGLRRVFPGHHE